MNFFRYIGAFLDSHWGDFIGLTLMFLGVHIILKGSTQSAEAFGLGQSLLVAGAAFLRPRPGNGSVTTYLDRGKPQ